MKRRPVLRSTSPAMILVVTLVAMACGGGDKPDAATAEAPAPDTAIRQVELEPLTEADLVDFEMTDLALQLPWTRNAVVRDPAEGAPRAFVEDAEASGHEGFDRAVFSFSVDAPFPGYEIQVVEPGLAVACGGVADHEADTADQQEQLAPEVEGDFFLVVRLNPARVRDDGRTSLPVRTERLEMTRMHEAGVTCDADDAVTWIAGLREANEIRVFELRAPPRLVIDVR